MGGRAHPRMPGGLFQEQFTYAYGLPTQVQLVAGGSNGSVEYDNSAVTQATFTATYQPCGAVATYAASQAGGSSTLTTTIAEDSTTGMCRPTRISSTWNSSTSFDTGTYTYDGVGNITAMGGAGPSDTFAYDARSRLISAIYAGQATSCTDSANNPSRSQCFGYDPYGNLTGVTGVDSRTLTTSTSTNQLTSGTYDYRGNLTAFSPDTLTYDDVNRQIENVNISSGDWQYLYDGGNERTVKTTTAAGGSLVPRREISRYIDQAKGWSTSTVCNETSKHFVDVHCADTDWKFILPGPE